MALHEGHFFGDDSWFGPHLGFGFPEILIGLLFFALQVAFWVGIVVLAVRLIRGASARGGRSTSALDVLEERYARGEITRDEFAERRAVLLGNEPARGDPPTQAL